MTACGWLRVADLQQGAMQLQRDIARRLPDVLGMAEALIPKSCQEVLDYERLETLGDACLKYSASLHLFNAFPNAHEGALPLRRRLHCLPCWVLR